MKARKLIAMLLVVATLMSFAPMAVFAADGTEGNKIVTVQYLFENGEIAADPWTASIKEGEDLSQTINHPAIVGYEPSQSASSLGTYATWGADALTLNITNITANITINVVYVPALVNYTVEFYQQNVDNDNYYLAETATLTGLTGSKVAITADKYAGFYELPYDKETTIAADGSTKVEVYYDRNYYLLSFDLGGGYGVDPQFLRYGQAVDTVGTPVRPGYTFQGWDKDVPTTMPATNTKLTAIWEAVDTAKVTIVYWGENANDEDYSYIKSVTTSMTPGTVVNGTNVTSTYYCGLEEHAHTSCTLSDHTHGNDCCTVEEHEHSSDCCSLGSIIHWHTSGCNTENCGNQTEHTHGDGNCVYSNTCYTCGKTAHTHTSDCATNSMTNTDLWTYAKSDNVTVAADGSTVVNVYYDRVEKTLTFMSSTQTGGTGTTYGTITAKWGASIYTRYKAIADAAYGGTYSWATTTNGGGSTGPWTCYFGVMPTTSATYYAHSASGTMTAYYYFESQTAGDYPEADRLGIIGEGSGYNVTDEDRVAFEGFTYDHGTENGDEYDGAKFYYTRNSYNLTFMSGSDVLKTESVKYEQVLSGYSSYTPANPPSYLEADAYEFGGWYQNPECTGDPVDFSQKMPAKNQIVYAKWDPIVYTVRVYLTEDSENYIEIQQDVEHRTFAEAPETPTNGQYTFVGWFYRDANGVEKAFDFKSMPITKDMNIYAKWSSKTLVPYIINYKLADGTVIADPTTGSILGGNTKTFDAKGGEELYTAYQVGYFPQTSSHSLTAVLEGTDTNGDGVLDANEYTFIYVQRDAVPYTVKYLDAETGAAVATEKYVEDNRYAVVTETAANVNGYLPDAFQKRLIVTDGGENVLIFYYTKDATHALVTEQHIMVNGAIETEYSSGQLTGTIGQKYAETKYDDGHIPGYVFDHATVSYYDANGNLVEDTYTSGTELTLTAGGLHFQFYYRYNRFDVYYQGVDQTVTYDLVDSFNAVAVSNTHAGVLYAGMYTDKSFTTPLETVGANDGDGMAFKPVAGATYYVKEIDNRYARPGVYLVWDARAENNLAMHKLYLMTAIDNNQYLEVGIELDYADDTKDVEHAVTSDDSKLATDNTDSSNYEALHEKFVAQFSEQNYTGVRTDTVTAASGFFGNDAKAANAYLYVTDFTAFVSNPEQVRYSCFFVTPDGIRVEGVKYRDLYKDSTIDNVDKLTHTNFVRAASGEISAVCTDKYPAAAASVMSFAPLMMRSAYSVSADIPDTYTITKIDGQNVETQKVEAGGHTGAITYAEKSGYIFAGWYTDKACTKAADFSDVQSDMTVYAKYVSAKHVNVNISALGKFMNATITTNGSNLPAIGLNYTFDGETTEVTCKQYKGVLSAIAKLLGSKSKTYTASWNMNRLANGDTFTATCYWVTADGTVVEIETNSYICSRNRISEQ